MVSFPRRNEILKVLSSNESMEEVILFGSRAKGSFRKNSDIDLAVKTSEELSFREKRKLREKVDEAAGIYSVDLLFWDEISEEMREQVEREGVWVWKR
jgi:predicted nucleotidyltransferase